MDNTAFLQEINVSIERTRAMLQEVNGRRDDLLLLLSRMIAQRDMIYLASGDRAALKSTITIPRGN